MPEQNAAPTIEVGQIWKDRDKRREFSGTVRKFRIVEIGEMIECRRVGQYGIGSKEYSFDPRRFGRKSANDSFVRCENEETL